MRVVQSKRKLVVSRTWATQVAVLLITMLDSDPPPLFAHFQTMCPKFCVTLQEPDGAEARLLPGNRATVASLLLQLLLHSLRAMADKQNYLY